MEGVKTDAGFTLGEPYKLSDGTVCEPYARPDGRHAVDLRLPLAELIEVDAQPVDQIPGGDQ